MPGPVWPVRAQSSSHQLKVAGATDDNNSRGFIILPFALSLA